MKRRACVLCLCLMFGVTLSSRVLAQHISGQSEDQDGSEEVRTRVVPELAWLLTYDGQPTDRLVSDKRFEPLLKRYFPATKMQFWSNKSLAEVAMQFLSGLPDKVVVNRHRYLIASACSVGSCDSRGMIWVDTHVQTSGGEPIIAFGVIEPDGKSMHLWLVSNKNFYDDPLSTPPDLRVNIGRWLMLPKHKSIGKIARFTVVDPSGQEEQDITPAVLGVPLPLVDLGN